MIVVQSQECMERRSSFDPRRGRPNAALPDRLHLSVSRHEWCHWIWMSRSLVHLLEAAIEISRGIGWRLRPVRVANLQQRVLGISIHCPCLLE